MKNIYFFSLLMLCLSLSAQEKAERSLILVDEFWPEDYGFFYKIGLATTLTINENYRISDNEDNGAFFRPNAFFINNTLGYKFDERSSLGINLEYDWHSESGLMFLPLHLSFRYTFSKGDVNPFIRSSYGRLLEAGDSFEAGSLYKVGSGLSVMGGGALIGIEFTQKRFGFRQYEKLNSVSFFIDLSF